MTKLKKYVVANDEIKKQNNFYKKNIIPIFIFVMVLAIMLSIGYSALNQNLSISGEAFLRVKEDVRITGIASSGSESEGYETYTPEYYKKSLKLYNTLPNAASKITYAGEISNTTSIKYKVSSVTVTSTNTNVECTSDLVENAVISPGKTTFYVVAKYKDGITVDQTNTDSVCNVNYEFDVYDFTPPTLTVRLVSKSDLSATFNIVAKDEVGGSGLSNTNIYKYCLSTSSTVASGCTWKNYVSGSDFTDIVSTSGTYYLLVYAVSDNAGNTSGGKANNGIYYSVLTVQLYITTVTFDYTGNEQTFIAPTDGYYRLETWGAQGGTHTTSIGGYGGYSTGIVKLNKGQILYINVGGTSNSTTGGYNGGGNGLSNVYGTGVGGGGATHIATSTGLLSTLSSNQNSILIVSGGGGGATSYTNGKQYFSGGSGGGMNGVVGSKHQDGTTTAAGTQTGGGTFGVGGNATAAWAGGAGSGFYGGTSGRYTAGAGGSGYIANSSLLTYDGVTKHMYCYNCTTSTADSTRTESNGTSSCTSETATTDCAKSGSGYAKITIIKADVTFNLIPVVDMRSTAANITINIKNTTDSDLSANNIYKYYISTSETSLIGGSWNDYTPGTAFIATGINETKYLWVYSISTNAGTINDSLETKNAPYMAQKLVFALSPEEYVYTGSVQTFIAPFTGNYEIALYGAKGGNGGLGLCSGGSGGAGGNGGYVKATVTLEANEIYTVWVGGKGTDSSYGDTQEGTGGLSDGVTGATGVRVSGGGGGGGGSTYIALESTVYLRANGGGGGGGGADGGWYRKSNGSTTCGGCKYRNMGAAGARGGNGGGGTLGGSGAANTCQASGYAGSNGTYYINQSYSTLVESGSTGTGDGRATIKYIS